MIPGLDQNHSDIRGNLRPDHLYKTLEALNQGLFRRLQGQTNNIQFGKHRIPEVNLIFKDFMKSDQEKSVSVFRPWLLDTMRELRINMRNKSAEEIKALGTKYIRPMFEFSLYHKDKFGYMTNKIDFLSWIHFS